MQLSDITPNLYPTHLLSECESGLCLFGAGFYGRNDAIHMFMAGMKDVAIVDTDIEKLKIMEDIYPATWKFWPFDIMEWISLGKATPTEKKWDIVSIDSPTNLFPWVLGNFDYISQLANKYIVITMSREMEEESYHYLDTQDFYLMNTMTRSVSGQVHLLILARGTGGSAGPTP